MTSRSSAFRSSIGQQIVAVEVEQVEGEESEPLGPAARDRLAQCVDMGDAALVRHRNLAVEHQRRQPGQLLSRNGHDPHLAPENSATSPL